MSADRVADLVRWWVRCYTRNLPTHTARRRIDELESDLHEQLAHERAAGIPDERIARELLGRALRGVLADLAWREHELAHHANPSEKEARRMSRRAAVIIAAVTAAVLAVPAVGMIAGTGTDWGVFDFVLAALLVAGTGAVIERVLRRPPALAPRLGLAAAGGAAVIAGELDDAPGLVGFGMLLLLLIAATTARDLRRFTARRS